MPSILTTNVVQAISFVLFLVALPLISFGTTDGAEGLWWTGLGMLVVAGVLPPLARFVPLADDDEEDDDNDEPDEAAADDGSDEKEQTA